MPAFSYHRSCYATVVLTLRFSAKLARRLHILFFISISGLLLVGRSTAEHYVSSPSLERCADGKLTIDGHVGNYINAVDANWLRDVPRANPAILEMFADRDRQPYRKLLPWSGEFAGKYLTSATEVLRLTRDPRLQSAVSQFVREFVAQQDADGYLGPFPKASRWTGRAPNLPPNDETWDAWGHYHAMVGLLTWYDETHDEVALASARKIGDLICRDFLDTNRPISSMGEAEMNQAIVHSLAMLYNATHEERYLKMAQAVVEDFQSPGAGDYLRTGLNGTPYFKTPKPRWESLHSLLGLAELYWITGNADYRRAFEHHWWSIAELDRHNNGGFSSGEKAQGNPYHPGAIETCCTVAWIAMSVDMLRMTGNSVVADELELSTLNQVLALHSPDGRWCTYNTPMDGRRVPSTVDIAFQIRPGSEQLNCCSVNAARGLGLISDWALMRDRQGIVLNWYGPSTFETVVGSTSVVLKQTTDYPFDGRIVLSVNPREPASFVLKLRIPHWSLHSVVRVNDEARSVEAGKYFVIDRTWAAGDQVVLDFDMSLRAWVGERECAGKASLYRGPLLLAFEKHAISDVNYGPEWSGDAKQHATKNPHTTLDVRFQGQRVEWHGAYYDDAGKTRVLIDGREVDVVDQFDKQRGRPFVWQSKQLPSGDHNMRLEATGERSSLSKGTWINASRFVSLGVKPEIDAKQVALSESVRSEPTGRLTLMLKNREGKTFELHDYATAGVGEKTYLTWLPVTNCAGVPFNVTNPSRTSQMRP